MITTNKNTEEEIDLIIMEAIGLSKGSLQTFKNNLQEIMLNAYTSSIVSQFFDLKEEIASLTNEVAMVFCSYAKAHNDYKSILKASSKIMKAIPLLKSCIK